MGGLGADAAIETADVIIMGDEPSRIASGIRIARRTSRIATENIIFAIAVKVLVMILSVMGYVDLWAGVLPESDSSFPRQRTAVPHPPAPAG